MSYYVKDSFDMPHNVGVAAKVVRLDDVFLRPNLFGGLDACVFGDSSNNPTEILPNTRIAIEDPGIRVKVGADGLCGACYPDIDDTVLVCERVGKFLCWYKVTYAIDDKTNE